LRGFGKNLFKANKKITGKKGKAALLSPLFWKRGGERS